MKSYYVTNQMKPLQQYVHKELLALQHFPKWNLELLFNLERVKVLRCSPVVGARLSEGRTR